VVASGTTEFPEPIGLGATFDPEAIHKMAVVISTEGRIKHVQGSEGNGGYSGFFQGLDFWARTSISFAIPLGPRPGDLRRRPVPHRAHGRCVRHRHAGRRSEIRSHHLHAQALRGAQRP